MSQLADVSDVDFESLVLHSDLPVLVDLWAKWCTPCKMLTPIVERIAADYAGKLTVFKLNADENVDTPIRFGVMGLPTLLLFKNGQLVETITGYQPKDRLLSKITPHL